MIPRYYVIAESEHELQNPTSAEKLSLLGQRLGLDPGARVLDIASGRGGPAVLLAREFGCTVHGIEIAPEFHVAALERAARAGIADRVSFELGDAATATFEPESYDAALCLGASFVFGGLADTVDALALAVRPGGFVAVGEPFWRRLAPGGLRGSPRSVADPRGHRCRLRDVGAPVVSVIASSEDDCDHYETLHWRTAEHWLAENRADPDAAEIEAWHERGKRTYLRHGRELVGWAIFVGWKRP